MAATEILTFKRGSAVNVRYGVKGKEMGAEPVP